MPCLLGARHSFYLTPMRPGRTGSPTTRNPAQSFPGCRSVRMWLHTSKKGSCPPAKLRCRSAHTPIPAVKHEASLCESQKASHTSTMRCPRKRRSDGTFGTQRASMCSSLYMYTFCQSVNAMPPPLVLEPRLVAKSHAAHHPQAPYVWSDSFQVNAIDTYLRNYRKASCSKGRG
jgi:hypothetical protein